MISNNFIKFLSQNEIVNLQKFINDNYSKNHILSKNKKLIEFYYNNQKRSKLNFLGYFIDNKLKAVLGYISYCNWDPVIKNYIYIAFLSKSKNYKKDVLFHFINFIYQNLKPNFLGCVGINKDLLKILKKISFCSKLSHYYIANNNIKKKVSDNLISYKNKRKNPLKMKITQKLNELPESDLYPKKTLKYFNQKYSLNPYYNYFFLNFSNKNKLEFFFVVRKIRIYKLKTNIFRIIDFYGKINKKTNILENINSFLQKNNAEYIDFLNYGLNEKKIISIGFKKKSRKQILPNRFEPFIFKNETVNLSIIFNKKKLNKITVCKGDGDQDRPNKI